VSEISKTKGTQMLAIKKKERREEERNEKR
jgi:hypothetical protein